MSAPETAGAKLRASIILLPTLAALACSAGPAPSESTTTVHLRESRPIETVRVSEGGGASGGARELRREGTSDGGSEPWVGADAGVEGGELAWLVAHIADDPDRLDRGETPNVRGLIARGTVGLTAILPLFRRGDAVRVPFARRVVERLAERSCRLHGGELAVGRLIAWFELGGGAPRRAPEPGARYFWARDPAAEWPREAIDRMHAWIRSGATCEIPADAPRSDVDAGAAPRRPR